MIGRRLGPYKITGARRRRHGRSLPRHRSTRAEQSRSRYCPRCSPRTRAPGEIRARGSVSSLSSTTPTSRRSTASWNPGARASPWSSSPDPTLADRVEPARLFQYEAFPSRSRSPTRWSTRTRSGDRPPRLKPPNTGLPATARPRSSTSGWPRRWTTAPAPSSPTSRARRRPRLPDPYAVTVRSSA